MQQLREGSAEAQYKIHLHTPVREYATDPVQSPRIQVAREMAAKALTEMVSGPSHERRKIIELGCGMADIGGWLSMGHDVIGYESAWAVAAKASKRWPWMDIIPGDLQDEDARPCDLLIITEILEHIGEPLELIKRWMPEAKYCLISSPLEGDRKGDSSGGEHLWSFDMKDFESFFELGGHRAIDTRVLPMGHYNIFFGLGTRRDAGRPVGEYKLFTTPKFHDAEFYKDRDVADHIHEDGHRQRLLVALKEIGNVLESDPLVKTVSDWASGNGGLLAELREVRGRGFPCWGYDLCPKNVKYASQGYQLDVSLKDMTKEECNAGDIVVLTEALEHLVDPHGLIGKLKATPAKWIIASSPAFETPENHYEFHLWAWTGDAYAKMFERAGFDVVRHYVEGATQFVVARNPNSKGESQDG